MYSFLKGVTVVCIFSVVTGVATESQGFVEGHLKIISGSEVELADGNTRAIKPGNHSQYRLIILRRDQEQIIRVTVDTNGNYRVALPPGDYVLDVQGRGRRHFRAKPQPFAVVSNQTVHVDMNIDTGVR